MCRLLGYVTSEPGNLYSAVLQTPNAMIVQSRRDRQSGKPNDAGWGYGFWDQNPEIIKRPTKPFEDPLFAETAGLCRRRAVVHIRRASAGRIAAENTHPFLFDQQLIFAHNGTISRFETVREKAMNRLPPELRGIIRGQTDSEYLMALFLSHFLKTDRLDTDQIEPFRRALSLTITDAENLAAEAGAEKPPELNFIFLTNHFLIATKILYWLGFYAGYGGGILISSEPLECSGEWTPLDERQMIAVRRDATCELSLVSST